MSTNYAFPVEMPFAKEFLAENYWRCSHTLAEDAALHFQIVIPRTWRPVDVTPETPSEANPLPTIAFFRSIAEPRGEIEVQLLLLPREVAPGEWLESYLETVEQEILHRRDHQTPGGTVSDFLTRAETPEGAVVSRWLAIKDLNRLFILQARTLEANYVEFPQFADAFFVAAASFTLMNPSDWELAEQLQTFSRAEPADFLIYVPESWTILQNDSSNTNALVLDIKNIVDFKTLGFITFSVVKRSEETDAQSLAANYIADLRKNGVQIPELLLTPTESRGGLESCWDAIAEVSKDGIELEVRILVGVNQDGWFLFGLLGSSRNLYSQMWLVNKRAFEILADRLKTTAKQQL